MQDDNDKNLTDDASTEMTPDTDEVTETVESPTEEASSDEETAPEEAVEESPSTSAPATAAGTDDRGRTLYNVKCSNCGKDTQVPFQPSEGRPVYCRDCFMKMKNS